MFTPRGTGFLGAREAFEKSFADLKEHQVAVLAAMQTAANELLNELSPYAVVKAAGKKKSMLGSPKGQYWDELARRWSDKSDKRENGILDAFLDTFADHYTKFGKRKQGT